MYIFWSIHTFTNLFLPKRKLFSILFLTCALTWFVFSSTGKNRRKMLSFQTAFEKPCRLSHQQLCCLVNKGSENPHQIPQILLGKELIKMPTDSEVHTCGLDSGLKYLLDETGWKQKGLRDMIRAIVWMEIQHASSLTLSC